MALISPKLDERRFDDLVKEALERVNQICPEWTDLSPGDPGRTLIEVFAYLTDILLHRLNRLPEKAFVEFLRLIGVQLRAPSASTTMLRFSLRHPKSTAVEILRGTRVTMQKKTSDGNQIIFITTETVYIDPGETSVDVRGLHCERFEAEFVGKGTGIPGQVVKVQHPPIVGSTGDTMDLVVGVEVSAEEMSDKTAAVQFDGKTYRIWQEVENFSNLQGTPYVYVSDRLQGMIMFAPAVRMQSGAGEPEKALAAIPAVDRSIRAWYRAGGGAAGNVPAGALTILKDQIPGVEVTNIVPATGGADAETLENALLRGPQQLHSLHRAVTARDFELLAKHASSAVNRAYAYTKAMYWSYAKEGTVEVLIVPNIQDVKLSGPVTAKMLLDQQTQNTVDQVNKELNKRKPLGTQCLVKWAKYKTVSVKSKIIITREEDPAAVKQRVMERLWQIINPLSGLSQDSVWPFGKQLTVWNIYKIISEEPGVNSVDYLHFEVDDAPGASVKSICADEFQQDAWYAGAKDKLFRSSNNGEGWELIAKFEGQEITKILSFPRDPSGKGRAGMLAVAVKLSSNNRNSGIYISYDCGEAWQPALNMTFAVEDMAWVVRNNIPVLLLATESGLYELAICKGADPKKIIVDKDKPDLGFYAVAASSDIWAGTTVAVASRGNQGVYLSLQSGRPESFKALGLNNMLIRKLKIQQQGTQRYLWAGTHVIGNEQGNGCFRWRLTGMEENPEGWLEFKEGWGGSGNCNAIAFQGSVVLAATDRMGVLWLDINDSHPKWTQPNVNCNLPLQPKADLGHLLPVETIAATDHWLLSGGEEGVFRSNSNGAQYEPISNVKFPEKVTLPPTWLFCSGKHTLDIVSEDERR